MDDAYYTIRAPSVASPSEDFRAGRLPDRTTHWVFPSTISHEARLVGEELALFLKREEHYDLPVYDGREIREREFLHLFTREPDVDLSIGIGACCFRFEQWTNRNPCFCLEWAWIHPFFRGRGILSSAWPEFVKRYESFVAYPPLTRGMKALLKKVGHPQGEEK